MPIKTMTSGEAQRIGLTRLGTLYKGAPKRTVTSKKNGQQIQIAGEDLDHFRVRFAIEDIEKPSEEDKIRLEMMRNNWQLCYGAEPRRFDDVKLCGTTPDNSTMSWYEWWDGSGLKVRCDGEVQSRYWNTTTLRYDTTPRACMSKSERPCECKPVMRLPILLLNFSAAIGEIGFFALVTHSVNDILNIYSSLQRFFAWSGNLSAITWVMERQPTELNYTDKDGKRSKVTKALISINANAAYVQQTLLAEAQAQVVSMADRDITRLPEGEKQNALPPPKRREDQPAIANSYALRNMKVRSAFLTAVKKFGFAADEVLDVLKEKLGVTSFNTDVDWFQACEALGVEVDPPSNLLENK